MDPNSPTLLPDDPFRGYNLVDHWGDPDAVPGFFYSRTKAAGVRRGGS